MFLCHQQVESFNVCSAVLASPVIVYGVVTHIIFSFLHRTKWVINQLTRSNSTF